jgi:hypothetical protein
MPQQPLNHHAVVFDETWEAVIRPGLSRRYFQFDGAVGISPPRFRPGAVGYTPVNAWWLSEISRLIYVRNPDEAGGVDGGRSGFLASAALREICFINGEGVQCALIATYDNAESPFAVLVFRGTSAFDTWLSNLNTIQADWCGGGLVHAGFKSEFYRIWDAVDALLSEVPAGFPLFYTGHSLGGAMALLAAGRRPAAAVYTFGAPKVGDAAFARSLRNMPIFRVVNNRDLVAVLPPSQIPFEFCHAGEPHHYSDGLCPVEARPGGGAAGDVSEQNGGRRSGASWFSQRFMRPPEFLLDHAPVNYSRRLQQEILSMAAVLADAASPARQEPLPCQEPV